MTLSTGRETVVKWCGRPICYTSAVLSKVILDIPNGCPYKQGVPASKIEPFYEDLGRRVQTYRNRIRLSQESLGSALEPRVTRASIANIEAGKQRVLTHTLVQLAVALDVEVLTLLPTAKKSAAMPSHVEAELAQYNIPTKTIRRLLKASQREKKL
jgi:transcriptional regulator with XRE-family HTH domain